MTEPSWKKQYYALLPPIFRFEEALPSHPPSCSFTSTKSCENLTWLKHQNQSITPDWLLNKICILSRQCTAHVGKEMRLGARGSWWYKSRPWMHTFWSEIHGTCLISCTWRLGWFYSSWIAWLCVCRGVCVSGCDVMSVNVKLNWNNWEIILL